MTEADPLAHKNLRCCFYLEADGMSGIRLKIRSILNA